MIDKYTKTLLHEQVNAWVEAVNAYRARDASRAADMLAGPLDADNASAYYYGVTLNILGAILCSIEFRKLADDPVAEGVDPTKFYSMHSDHPLGILDPSQVCAAQCITVAANGDFTMVGDLVNSHCRPDDPERGCTLLLELLRIYVDLQDANEQNAHS